jgi:hypothetical protein
MLGTQRTMTQHIHHGPLSPKLLPSCLYSHLFDSSFCSRVVPPSSNRNEFGFRTLAYGRYSHTHSLASSLPPPPPKNTKLCADHDVKNPPWFSTTQIPYYYPDHDEHNETIIFGPYSKFVMLILGFLNRSSL